MTEDLSDRCTQIRGNAGLLSKIVIMSKDWPQQAWQALQGAHVGDTYKQWSTKY